jgi:hypothetical protein
MRSFVGQVPKMQIQWWLLRTKGLDGGKSGTINYLWQSRREIDMFFILPFSFLFCKIRIGIMKFLWNPRRKNGDCKDKT